MRGRGPTTSRGRHDDADRLPAALPALARRRRSSGVVAFVRATMVASSNSGGGSAATGSRPVTAYGGTGFEEFVHAEFLRLWRLGRVLSGRDDDAWDLAQEALVKVGLRWSRIDRNGNPG